VTAFPTVYLAVDSDCQWHSGPKAAQQLSRRLLKEGKWTALRVGADGHDPNSFLAGRRLGSSFKHLLEEANTMKLRMV